MHEAATTAAAALERAPPDSPWVARFVTALRQRCGEGVVAILLYGSFARGKRDTVLDFYVLLDSYRDAPMGRMQRLANAALPPNVYYLALAEGTERCAAKYATMAIDHFERAVRHDFHSYFWARFAQPTVLAYERDDDLSARLSESMHAAANNLIARTLPLMPAHFSTVDLWTRAFTLSYGCELRAESVAKAGELVAAYDDYLTAITPALAQLTPNPAVADHWFAMATPMHRYYATASWWLRRVQGKLLSLARLMKAAFTFNDALDYILWKIERHSGVYVEPTELQRRYPLLFSWGLLWRVYRKGGFR